MSTSINYRALMDDVLKTALAAKTAEITEKISGLTSNVVQAGPFKGMILPEGTSWGLGDVVAKLVGAYEQELHPTIEKAIARAPELVYNVGSAEGFYAIGLALRLPKSTVYPCDTFDKARKICKEAAALNNAHNTYAHSYFSHEHLPLVPKTTLIIMDVEGDELKLLMQGKVSAFRYSDIIVECHDFKDPSITPTLLERFKDTHDCEIILEQARDPYGIPMLETVGAFEKILALCEFRPTRMWWLACWSKERA